MDEAPTDFRLLEPASPDALLPATPLWVWITTGSVIAILLAAILYWLIHRNRHRQNPTAIRDAAMHDALAALNQLAEEAPIRDAATRMSWILRRFLSTTTNDPALFETHEEFISRQDSLLPLSEATRDLCQQTFNQLAKLKYTPDPTDVDRHALVDDCRNVLHSIHKELPT